jgi:hypothetical protein
MFSLHQFLSWLVPNTRQLTKDVLANIYYTMAEHTSPSWFTQKGFYSFSIVGGAIDLMLKI